MPELSPINNEVTLRGVHIFWPNVNGKIPKELDVKDGASTSTTEVVDGKLLKRGYLGPDGLKALIVAIQGGKITIENILDDAAASVLLTSEK